MSAPLIPISPFLPASHDAYSRALNDAITAAYRTLATRLEDVVIQDTLANRPTANGTRRLFFAQDTDTLYFDDGAWTTLYAKSKWTTVGKVSDSTTSADTVLTADPEIKFPMLANTVYRFRAFIIYATTALADFKFRHSGPAAPGLVLVQREHIIAGGSALTQATDLAYSAADVALVGAATGFGWISFDGSIHNGANAGDFEFQWAQNTSDATANSTTVYRGSYIEYATGN